MILMKKRVLSILLSIFVLIGMLSVAAIPAFAGDDAPATLTMRDIFNNVEGTYSGKSANASKGNLATVTFKNIEFRAEIIFPYRFAHRKTVSDAGTKVWLTSAFGGVTPVFPYEPVTIDIDETLDKFLDNEIEITKVEKTLADGIVIPAGSYYVSNGNMYFYNEQSGKTQKMYIDTLGDKFVLDRVSEVQGEGENPADPVCPKCGGTHCNNFCGRIVCFFNRLINRFMNLFN